LGNDKVPVESEDDAGRIAFWITMQQGAAGEYRQISRLIGRCNLLKLLGGAM
jgi:hypothetical protein